MTTTLQAKDLTKEAPRSAYATLGGYAILPRAIDKGRATIAGTNGDFNFDCPVDNAFLSFVGLKGEDMKALLATGASDEEVLAWVKEKGTPKTDAELAEWAESFHHDYSYAHHTDVGKQAWFRGECARLNLDPEKTTLFDFLDADDKTIGK